MAIDYGYLIGYAGFGKIISQSDGVYKTSLPQNATSTNLFLQSGNVVRNLQIPSAGSYYLNHDETITYVDNGNGNTGGNTPSNTDVKSKIRLGYGTYSYTGNITIELTRSLFNSFFSNAFFSRKFLFHLIMSDGEQKITVLNNVWNNVNFNYSSQQIPTCSISFNSNNGGLDDLNIVPHTATTTTANTEELVPYWEAGMNNVDIESFNVTFSRNVSNIYLNNDWKTPTYLLVGLIEMSLGITCFDTSITGSSGVDIYFTKDFYMNIPNTVIDEVMQNKTYTISGLDSAGMRSFNIDGIRDKSTDSIFTLKKVKKS